MLSEEIELVAAGGWPRRRGRLLNLDWGWRIAVDHWGGRRHKQIKLIGRCVIVAEIDSETVGENFLTAFFA